jgi:hypothetical protein
VSLNLAQYKPEYRTVEIRFCYYFTIHNRDMQIHKGFANKILHARFLGSQNNIDKNSNQEFQSSTSSF